MPAHYVQFLTGIEVTSAGDAGERMNRDVEEVTGRKPMGLEEWVKEEKGVWQGTG